MCFVCFIVTLSYCSLSYYKFMIFFFNWRFSLNLLKITMLSLDIFYSLFETLSSIVRRDLMMRFSCYDILSTTSSTSGGISTSSYSSFSADCSFCGYLIVCFVLLMFYCCSTLLVAFFSFPALLTFEICWFLGPSRMLIFSIWSGSRLVFQIIARESLPPVAK